MFEDRLWLLVALPVLAACGGRPPGKTPASATPSVQPVLVAAGIDGTSITVDPQARPSPTSVLVTEADAICDGVKATPATIAHEEAACAAHDLAMCYELSKHLWCGAAIVKDRSRATQLNSFACNGGYLDACPNAAMSAMVAGEVARAVAFVEKGCRGRDTGSCNVLATMFLQGDGIPRYPARSAQIYSALCDSGDAMGCANIATMLVAGIGLDRDLLRARDLARRACDGHAANGCDLFGFLLAFAAPADLPRSLTVLDALCAAGDAEGCDDLGAVLSGPGAAAKDAHARALAAFKAGCDLKRTEACEHLRAAGTP